MLEEKIAGDYREAMKSRDQVKTGVLSFLRSQLKYCAIEAKQEKLEDAMVIGVLKKSIKQRQESIEQFEKGNRMDLVEKEVKELEILKSYLPEELSKEEVARLIEEVISVLGAGTMKDMGRVMKEVQSRTGGRVDNKALSEAVRSRLGAGA